MNSPEDLGFLHGCDNTLLDNVRVQDDLGSHLAAYPQAALIFDHIGDLIHCDLAASSVTATAVARDRR